MSVYLGCSGLWDPIKCEDVGKVQIRFVERAVVVVRGNVLGDWAREH